jgi:CheY-like chemotaxis protein
MNKQHAVEEFLNNYRTRDLIKARVVVDYLGEIEKEEQRRILFELIKADDDFAIPMIAYLAYRHPEISRETPQLHNTLLEKAISSPSIILKCLVAPKPETGVYADLAGKIRLREALPLLRQLLNQAEETEALAAVIKTLGLLEDEKAVDSVGEYLFSDNEILQSAAMRALGDINNDKALQILFSSLEKLPGVRSKTLDILADLQTEASIHLLNNTLVSDSAEIRTLGKTRLIELGIKAIPVLTHNLSLNHPDLQIHTLNVLQEIGDDSAVKSVRHLLNSEPEDDNVRFAAFEALAHLPNLKGDYLLATGLTDRDDSIRLAAARAIDNNLDAVLTAGIKNMINNEDGESVRIIKAIIDAETTDLFVGLLDLPFFDKIGLDYVATKVHRDIRNHYLNLLKEKSRDTLVDRIEQKAKEHLPKKDRPLVCAVDDSPMILSVYRRVLNELGFEPVLFEFPESFLDWLPGNKPLALFTDLNMPKITGLELTSRVRRDYDSVALPIIMVTTQKEGKDDSELKETGVTRIMSKPFDTEAVRATLNELSISSGEP